MGNIRKTVIRKRVAMPVKGFHQIKTHLTLAREGKLVSVARDWHKSQNGEGGGGVSSFSDWNPGRHVFNKEKTDRRPRTSSTSFSHDLNFESKVKSRQIEEIQNSLQEMRQAAAEGLPVASGEIERLKKRLEELKTESKN